MRQDSPLFIADNSAVAKQPRYVIAIDFDGIVQYFTSHDDIANVPGTPIDDVVAGISATSQTLNPERANATIGSMSFDLIDLANAVTNKFRTELDTNDVGLRGRTCSFYLGYKSIVHGVQDTGPASTSDNPDFDEFVLFQTQIIRNVDTKDGKYTVHCADIQRETKKQIFTTEITYLTDSLTDSDTTVKVLDLSGFEGNDHGTSYADAPSTDGLIYIRIDQTKEIIRCPVADIVGNDFTNVTRGALNTKRKAVEVDQTLASDRRPKVEEYVYLELPAVKMAYAILTGIVDGTAAGGRQPVARQPTGRQPTGRQPAAAGSSSVLPSNWHAAVPTALVRLADFKAIGTDLWDIADDTKGIILRFDGIEKQDAKKFLETEIYLLLGLFSPVYADGQLGLKRMVPALADSPFIFDLDDANVSGSGNLRHDMESMLNNLRIDWNWNGDRFIRSTIVVDSNSITRHGTAPEKRIGFRGLVGTRFTEQVLRQLLTSLRDMYSGPPLRLDLNCQHMLNRIEVGDAARVNLSNIRDYSAVPTNLQRTMVVHGMTVDWLKGVKLKMFGSSERADEIPPVTATTCLPDAFYSAVGTALNTIGGLMTGDVTNAGTFTLSGDPDMNAAAAVFYHDGPLTISSTTTLIIENNVQLRVKGFITIDGLIDGTGEGHPTDTNLFDLDQFYFWGADEQFGTPGFIGNSMSHGGLYIGSTSFILDFVWVTPGFFTRGLFDSFPNVILQVDDAGSGLITGIPTDMRGGGGAYGNRAGDKVHGGQAFQKTSGGAGGAGGAGLCIICRGGDFGISGDIILDGDPSVEPTTFHSPTAFDIYGGAGGAGAPGALLWLLDGSSQTFPDIAGHFSAKTGLVPAQFALPFIPDAPSGGLQNRNLVTVNAPTKNMAPVMPDAISGFDQTGVNFRISFLPCDVVPVDDQDTLVVAPSGLTATAKTDGNLLNWTNPTQETFNHVEVHASDDQDRTNAVQIAEVTANNYFEVLKNNFRNRYYWIRAIDVDGLASAFHPLSSTAGVLALPLPQPANLLVDPDFDLSTSIGTYTLLSRAVADLDNFWAQFTLDENGTPTTVSSITFQSGGGVNGSNAIKLVKGDPPDSPTRSTGAFIATARFRQNQEKYKVAIRWRNQGASAFDDVTIRVRGWDAQVQGSVWGVTNITGQSFSNAGGATWQMTTFDLTTGTNHPNAEYWEFEFLWLDNTAPAGEMEIDSIFVFAVP